MLFPASHGTVVAQHSCGLPTGGPIDHDPEYYILYLTFVEVQDIVWWVSKATMIPVRPIEQINQRRLRRSIQAYLDGEQNLKWILGVIDSEEALALQSLLARFPTFAGTPRYEELKAALEARLSSRTAASAATQDQLAPTKPPARPET